MRGFALRLGAAVSALSLATAGLAFAGVDLPDPAKLAGGDSEHARSDEVKDVIDATPPSNRGCEFGHQVAEAAKGSPLPEPARAACAHGKSHAAAHGARRRTEANGGSDGSGREFGHETAERAHGLGDATVEQRRQFGHETSDRAKQLGGAPAAKTPAGPPSERPAGPPADTPSPHGSPGGPPDGH